MVLLRQDDLAQVIIHTANMIEQDWRNMTQGVWLSPLLPRKSVDALKNKSTPLLAIGTADRFKRDFMSYLRYYGNRTANLVSQLENYDFASIRAALIAHVPSKFQGKETTPSAQLWGWPALKRALESIPSKTSAAEKSKTQVATDIVCQVSSIASLADKWIRDTLFSTLSTTSIPEAPESTKSRRAKSSDQAHTRFSIIFPTPNEIKICLDGYAAGGSIHCKLQTAAQRKQFDLMKPYLCHWNALQSTAATGEGGRALRGPAAPHIKTFMRFRETSASREIDWALLTSANMSTQAWGTAAQPGSGEVRISSYELGVLVWPDLFLEDATFREEAADVGEGNRIRRAVMIPSFGSDMPTDAQIQHFAKGVTTTTSAPSEITNLHRKRKDIDSDGDDEVEKQKEELADEEPPLLVALRMPYDLPLTPYSADDEVWSARSSYPEPDIFGRVWNV